MTIDVNVSFGLNSNTVEFNDHCETVREGSTTFLNFWEKPEGRDQISFELVIALQFPAKHGNSVKFRDEVIKVREDASMRYNTENVTVLRVLPHRSRNSVTVLSYWPGDAKEVKLSESNTFKLLLPFGDKWRTEIEVLFNFSFDHHERSINIPDQAALDALSYNLWSTANPGANLPTFKDILRRQQKAANNWERRVDEAMARGFSLSKEPAFVGIDLARQCRNCVKAEDSFIDYEVGDRIEKCTNGILFCTEKSIKVPAGWDECKDGFEAIEVASEEPEVKSATHCEACGCARRFYLYGSNNIAIEESNSVLPASKPSAVWKDHERYCVRHMRIVPASKQGCGHFAAINNPDQCEDEPKAVDVASEKPKEIDSSIGQFIKNRINQAAKERECLIDELKRKFHESGLLVRKCSESQGRQDSFKGKVLTDMTIPELQEAIGSFESAADKPTSNLEAQEELAPERFTHCIINHMLESAVNWAGDDAGDDGDWGDQDEICADLAEQNQQLQKRVDELEKCLAVQEEQISDYAKELDDLEADYNTSQVTNLDLLKVIRSTEERLAAKERELRLLRHA